MDNNNLTTGQFNNLKVALAHDFLNQYGGAERVLEALCEIFPEAPIYTLLYDKEKMRGKFENREIHASFLQNFPKFLKKRTKWLLPFLPVAPETFDLRDYDLVVSSSGAWAKGIITRLNTAHICYMHSPMRFAWGSSGEYLKDQKNNSFTNFLARLALNRIRIWDKVAADRPDYIISNSIYTRDRVKKYYGRESEVIYPPVETTNGSSTSIMEVELPRNYFLIVSRLSPYKRIDAAVEAFNKLELPLVIVGEGSQSKYLKKIARGNIKFLGWQENEKIAELYKNARAFLFPGIDDFGIAPVEAMGYGVPVLAIRKGGAKETVIEGKTGEFFDAATPEVIADGVRRFCENEKNYDKEFIKQRAREFSRERFVREFEEYIKGVVKFT